MTNNRIIIFGIVAAIMAAMPDFTWAQPAPKSTVPALGREGTTAKTKRHQFDVFFYKTGVKVLPTNVAGAPVSAERLKGTVTFTIRGASKPFVYQLTPANAADGRPSGILEVAVDLSRVPTDGTTVDFKIEGLTDLAEPSTNFSVLFKPTVASAAKTRPVSGPIKVSQSTKADQAAIQAQKTCPVSGEGLTSMGVPIKLTQNDRAVFLCCNACVKKVQADPSRYFRSTR